MRSQNVILQAAGLSKPLWMEAAPQSFPGSSVPLLGAIIAVLSAGGSLIYNIEIIGTNTLWTPASGYPANEPWGIADSALALTASTNYEFSGYIIACRINITSYTSGSLNASFVQP